jgi:hypothetical protein
MPNLVLLVGLLLALVSAILCGGLAYLVHRHPSARDPLVAGLSGMALLVATVIPLVVR